MVIDLGPTLRSTNYAISFFWYLRSVFQSTNWILLKGIYTLRHGFFTISWHNFFFNFFEKLKKLLKFTLVIQNIPNFCSKYNKKLSQKTTALKIVFQSTNQIWWREFLLFGIDWLLSFLKLPWMAIKLRRILFSKLDSGEGDPMSN